MHGVNLKLKQFYFITTIPGLQVSTPSSHHQALQGMMTRGSRNLWPWNISQKIKLLCYDWYFIFVCIRQTHRDD